MRCGLWLLTTLSLIGCGGRVAMDEGVGDAGATLDAPALCASSPCPDPSSLYPGAWCGGQAVGLCSATCPTSVPTPQGGTPVTCLCGGEFWECSSTSLAGCKPQCPPPSEVTPWGNCDFPTDVTCHSSATFRGGACSCFCSGLGDWNCTTDLAGSPNLQCP